MLFLPFSTTPCVFASERECREWLERSPNTANARRSRRPIHLHELAVMCTSLPPQRSKQLREIAAAFPKLFSYSPGKIKGMEVDMELIPNAKPVRHPIQQFGRAQAEIVRHWITSALADGSYERARPDNDWASRVHIAPSRNASGMLSKMRICGDYRDVNKLLTSVAQRTPNPDAIKEALAGFTFYGKCDLAVGYGNLALSPRTRQILAVWTPTRAYATYRRSFRTQKLLRLYANCYGTSSCYCSPSMVWSLTVRLSRRHLLGSQRLGDISQDYSRYFAYAPQNWCTPQTRQAVPWISRTHYSWAHLSLA